MTTERARRLSDGLLTIGLAGLTFLLGCKELFDADIWWQVRAGRWIVENRAVPRVDPFTFASAGGPWLDMHWLFQLALVAAYGAGGVAGTILLAAGAVTTAFLAGFLLRDRDWPAWVVVAGWLPGLLLTSTRFGPRPELVTLVGLSVMFGVLLRARRRPAWLWVLVPLQIVWINAHGLFVLGPWMLGLFLVDRAVMPAGQPRWRSLLPASAAVVAACLVNPYGLRGVLFPLELYPKLTEAGGSYKHYISEFMSPRMVVEGYWSKVPGRDLYLRLFVFGLAALPASALVVSLRRAWAGAEPDAGEEPGHGERHPETWAGAMVLALGLALVVAAGLPGPSTPAYLLALGRAAPWVMAGLGAAAAGWLVRRNRFAALLALVGSGAVAAWVVWLVNSLEHPEPVPAAPAALALGLGIPAALLAIRAGTRPFTWSLAASFALLALLSVRNMSLFGLISGAVLAAELGAFAAALGRGRRAGSTARVLAPRLLMLGVLGVLALAVTSHRFYAMAEECHRFGLRERPFYYAHDACRFAARPGLPARALVFGLNQAAVYVEQNAPAHQVFIDGRLEVASRQAFELYVRLHRALTAGDPRWADIVARMGNPLILLNHDNILAEATLLSDPRWRCVYVDAVAMVFLPRGLEEKAYPAIDFAGRHFDRRGLGPPVPAQPGAEAAEAQALARIAAELAPRPVPIWSLWVPLLLTSMDRARQAIAVSRGRSGARPWTTLGHAALGLGSDPALWAGSASSAVHDGPAAPWDPATGLAWAQASAAYRRSVLSDPTDADGAAAQSLKGTFTLRGIVDADLSANAARHTPTWPGVAGLEGAVNILLREGRAAAALELGAEARRRGIVPAWPLADRLACAALHLGDPSAAARLWADAAAAPSAAVRQARLADASFAAWDLDAAGRGYHRALELDPALADAQLGLALVNLQQGRAAEGLTAARRALDHAAEPRRRALLEGIISICEPYARGSAPAP